MHMNGGPFRYDKPRLPPKPRSHHYTESQKVPREEQLCCILHTPASIKPPLMLPITTLNSPTRLHPKPSVSEKITSSTIVEHKNPSPKPKILSIVYRVPPSIEKSFPAVLMVAMTMKTRTRMPTATATGMTGINMVEKRKISMCAIAILGVGYVVHKK
jgi:hypothetical protein